MTDQEPAPTHDVLDVLVDQLLACAALISRMMADMQEHEASGFSSPDAPPSFEVAHSLIRSIVNDLTGRYSDDEVRISSVIVAQATVAIFKNMFFVAPAEIPGSAGGSGSARAQRRQARQPSRRRRR